MCTGDMDKIFQERNQYWWGYTYILREPQKESDINATEDFLKIISIAHIIDAALEYSGMEDIHTILSFHSHVHKLINAFMNFDVLIHYNIIDL